MKKLVIGTLFIAVIVGLYLVMGLAYKDELYELAMNAEKSRAGLTEQKIEVNGLSVSYMEGPKVDDRSTLLLIHGFAANKENWIRFAGHLTDQYNVVALDLLGHGKSTKNPALSHDIDDQVAYLNRFMKAKNISQAHLVGNSMGGAISSLFAATHPEQALSVVLVNPAGIFDHRSVLQDYLDKGENPLVVKKEEDIYTLMEFAMVEPPFVPWPIPLVVAERAMANKALNDQIFDQIKSEHHNYDFKQELTRIKVPTLIMWGTEDKVINYRNSEIFNQLIPVSEILIYQDIGHAPMIEIPEKSANDVDQFIKKHA